MNLNIVYKIMKARWNLEKSIFNNFKNNASLNHCFVHGYNAGEKMIFDCLKHYD